ncbi:hypothetical protein [Lysinibacillus xylanilyticus]|uniref:hypothetical protein n=1 Tax=Lysinibacillus xylanilyticus TaxID=582475 RepID=UPI003D062223
MFIVNDVALFCFESLINEREFIFGSSSKVVDDILYLGYKLIGVEAGRLQEALLCAKAKRQQQSARSEMKSTIRYSDNPYILI